MDLLRILLRLLCSAALRAALVSDAAGRGGDVLAEVEADSVASAASVLSLCTHREHAAEAWWAAVESAAAKLLALEGDPAELAAVPVEQVVLLACRVNSNAYGLGDPAGLNTDVGFGIFPFAAMFNHSCSPNCCFTGGAALSIRATPRIRC